jgi:hypothetical protein
MSLGISISVSDYATPAVRAKLEKCSPPRLAAILGPGLKKFTQRHLLANGPNKRGWPTTNFWARAAKATSWTSTGDGVVISINQIGVRQRYHGGQIRPVSARALTIPISPEAHGKTASDFPGAFLLKTKKGAYLVQRGESMSAAGNTVRAKGRGFAAKRVSAALEFLFALKGSVNQKADPSVIPAAEDYRVAAVALIEEAIR